MAGQDLYQLLLMVYLRSGEILRLDDRRKELVRQRERLKANEDKK